MSKSIKLKRSELEKSFGRYIVELYRAWQEFEIKQKAKDRIEAKDFDIVPDDFERLKVNSRDEVIEKLESLGQQITPTLEYLRLKTISTATYIKAQEGSELLSLEEYCLKTLGIKPKLISAKELDKQKKKQIELYSFLALNPHLMDILNSLTK